MLLSLICIPKTDLECFYNSFQFYIYIDSSKIIQEKEEDDEEEKTKIKKNERKQQAITHYTLENVLIQRFFTLI